MSSNPNPASSIDDHLGGDRFRPDIEGLRGLAILLVVAYHAGLPVTGGFIGVDVFFVISGFLITGLLLRDREQNGSINIGRFYARRVRRLLPAASLVALFTLLLADRLVAPLDRPSVSLDGAAAALSVANVRFALTADYFSPVGSPSPFLHFWSLGVEEQFYLLWPALLTIAAHHRPRLGAGIVLGAVFVASLGASALATTTSPSAAFYLLPTRAWELAAGGLLALGVGLPNRTPRLVGIVGRGLIGIAAWAGLVAIIVSAVMLDSSVAYPGLLALIPTTGAVLLIAGGTARLGPGWLMTAGPVRFTGRISYSLYLWHWPVLVLGGLTVGGALSLGQSVGLVGVAFLLAVATWALVEEPFRRGRVRLPSRSSRTIAVGVASLLVVAVIGTTLEVSEVSALAGIPVSTTRASTQPSPAGQGNRPAGPTQAPSLVPGLSRGPTPTSTTPSTPKPQPPVSYALTPTTRPALVDARTDYERTWHDGCLGSLASTTPHDCVYGAPNGTFTVALVGDSHASALFPAVEAVALKHGWRLLTFVKVACPLVDLRLYNAMLKREYTECATWNANVLTRLQANRPDLVLVSNSRWVFPVLGADQTGVGEGLALARMIKRIPSRVVIINDVPLPTIDVPACLAANPSDVRQCAVPRSQALGYGMGVIEKTAAAQTGADVIDLTAGICPGRRACPVVIGNVIVYRDGHHLTATFSRTLAPLLDLRLRAVLGYQ